MYYRLCARRRRKPAQAALPKPGTGGVGANRRQVRPVRRSPGVLWTRRHCGTRPRHRLVNAGFDVLSLWVARVGKEHPVAPASGKSAITGVCGGSSQCRGLPQHQVAHQRHRVSLLPGWRNRRSGRNERLAPRCGFTYLVPASRLGAGAAPPDRNATGGQAFYGCRLGVLAR